MHRLIATVCSDDPGEAVRLVGSIPAAVAMGEVRLDALWPAPPGPGGAADLLAELVAAASVPLLATLRPTRQGGSFTGPEEVRLGLLEAAARAGFAAIDVENDLDAMAPLLAHLRTATRRIVLSNHLGTAPPADLGLRHLTAMQDLGGTLHKLAFPVAALPHVLRGLELVHQHAARGGRPAVQVAGAGAQARALMAIAGNQATYARADGGGAGVAGQPAVSEVVATWRHWGIGPSDLDAVADASPHPRWFAVLGAAVGTSLSPQIHNAALRAAGRRPERFGALDVPATPGMLRLVVHAGPRIGLAGASVTAPHKADLVALADPDGIAAAVGAANCLWFEGTTPRCTNTDATALARLLRGVDGKALVLGAGGAARAAIHALRSLGTDVAFTNRDAQRGAAVQADLDAPRVPWQDRHKAAPDILVNATPADAWSGPVPATVVEMRYMDGPTRSEVDARKAGAHLIDGRAVLVAQAEDAYRVWTGSDPPPGAMTAALEDA